MIFSSELFDELLETAKTSERLRINLDLRNGNDDNSQRMLNAILPASDIPIHRHSTTSETVLILKGVCKEIFYDEDGNVTAEYILDATGENRGLHIPKGQWHKLIAMEPTVICEVKDGAYAPIPPEDTMPR